VCLIVALIGLVASLLLHKGDWRFRGPSFAVVAVYLSFMVFELWQFFTNAD
jgi:hypothetical protein